MKTWNILVTGSNGLIGSEAVEYFDRLGHRVTGIDNNMRRLFFGASGDTQWNLRRLREGTKRFTHIDMDLRDRARLFELFAQERFDLVLHCAAQPSHDKAAEIPLLDFEVNAVATIYLLEAVREHCPGCRFYFYEHQQGVRRSTEREEPERAAHALRLRRSRKISTASTKPAGSTARYTRFSELPRRPRIFTRRSTEDILGSTWEFSGLVA